MRKFAEIDENNLVVQVLVCDTQEWLEENLGGVWVETFAGGGRGLDAGIGYTYDADADIFVAPIVEVTDEIV